MKKVLVTGGTGFIGRPVIAALAAAGYDVHRVIHQKHADPLVSGSAHQADLHNEAQVATLLRETRPTHLLHLAWHVPPLEFWTSLENFRWVRSSLHLMTQFVENGGTRWLSAGTCAEYDWSGDGFCQEGKTPLQPVTVYGTCKHALQQLQSRLAAQTGRSAAWARLFQLYGPDEPRGRLVPDVITSLLQKQPIRCTRGDQVRDYLHVEDAARALVMILDSEWNGPINVASGSPQPVAQLVETIADAMDGRAYIQMGALPDRPGTPSRLTADVSVLRSLGFSPRMSLRDGLSRTIDWWRQARVHS